MPDQATLRESGIIAVVKRIRLLLCLVFATALLGCEPETAVKEIVEHPPVEAEAEPEKPPQVEAKAVSQDPSELRIYQTSELQKSKVKVKGKEIPVWIADNETKRQEGMMWLQDNDVSDGHGMLFVFSDEVERGFYMRNTLIPLDIVYIDAKGKVVSIAKGKPKDEANLPSGKPAKYVLELKEGEARKFRINRGTSIEIPGDLKSID